MLKVKPLIPLILILDNVSINEYIIDYFTQPFGQQILMWQSVDSSTIKYFMVNTCGIQFANDQSQFQSIVSRDTINCTQPNKTTTNFSSQNFQNGALSVTGDRSVAKMNISIKEVHNQVNISMDVIFILPRGVSDAIFKMYYHESSGYKNPLPCGFFTNKQNSLTCNLVDEGQIVKFAQINISFPHYCEYLEVILEFVADWQESVNNTYKQNNQPLFFMTNLQITTSNNSFVPQTLSCSARCSKCYDPLLIDFNLFSMQGVPDPIVNSQLLSSASQNKLRCCQCSNASSNLTSCQSSNWIMAQFPTLSDISQSVQLLQLTLLQKQIFSDLSQVTLDNYSQYFQQQSIVQSINNNSVVNFTYHIYSEFSEYNNSWNQTNQFGVQYLPTLVEDDFKQIFSVYLDSNLTNMTYILNMAQVSVINYELIFYGDNEGNCLFNIPSQLDIIAQMQTIVPSIQSQNIIFRSADNRTLNVIVTGSLRIIGFTNVTFQNMSFDVSDDLQEDKIVSFLIKPLVLDASFTLSNINITMNKQMRVLQLKFILDEFQGSIRVQNIQFTNLSWFQQHSFIEFSQSNRFMDKLYEAKSYRPQAFLYDFMIDNIKLTNCLFQASVNLLTFATSNVQGYIRNIMIENSEFNQGSNIITSFSSIESVQFENSIVKRELQISNILVTNSTFTDTSRLISVSLQKVALTQNKTMRLEISNITINSSQFNDQTTLFYNDHSYFNNYLSNVSITNSNFSQSSTLVQENSEMINPLELVFYLSFLDLQNVQFKQQAMMFSLINKNIILKNIIYIDLAFLETKIDVRNTSQVSNETIKNIMKNFTKGTLINIINFKTFVTISNVQLKGTVQGNQLININDQMGQNMINSAISIVLIQSCVFSNITLISEGSWILAGAPVYIASIRDNLQIIFNETQWLGNIHQSSLYSIYSCACLFIEAQKSDIFLLKVILSDNWAVNAQTGITIIRSKSVSIFGSNFSNSSFENLGIKGPGGHLYLSSQNISIEQSQFQYSNASNGGAIYIDHYIKETVSKILINNCLFRNATAYSSQSVGEGGAILISFDVDQNSQNIQTFAIVQINNSNFSENIAQSGCGAIQLIPNVLTNITLSVINTNFTDNYGLKAFSIDITDKDNTIIQGLVNWNLDVTGCSMTQSNVSLNSSNLQRYQDYTENWDNLPNVKYNEIYTNIHFSSSASDQNIVNLTNITFINNSVGSLFSFELIEYLTLQDILIDSTNSTYQPLMYLYGSISVNFTKVIVKNNVKILDTNDTIRYQSNLLSSALIIIQNTLNFRISKSVFSNNTCPQCTNGLIFLANVQNSSFINCHFFNNWIIQGGGIAIRNISRIIQFFALTQGLNLLGQNQNLSPSPEVKLQLINSSFSGNNVTSGGALFITIGDQTNVTIEFNNVTFQNNSAQYGTVLRVVGRIYSQYSYYSQFYLYIDENQIYPLAGKIIQQNTTDLPNDLNRLISSIPINEYIFGCLPGYTFVTEFLQCVECPNGTYVLQGNQFDCKTCPQDYALECEGDTINLLPGYWRENNQTDEIIECQNSELCVSKNGQICLEGHSGALCESCDLIGNVWNHSYTKSSDRICVECDVQVFQVLRTCLAFLFVFLGMNIAVNSTVDHITLEICVKYLTFMKFFVGARNRDALFAAVYLKILATHFIVVTLVLNMNLPIPSQLSGIFGGVGSPLNQMLLSQDCLLITHELPLPLIYFRIVLSLVYPFAFYLLYVLSKIILAGFDNRSVKRGTYSVGALFITLYMQPNLFQIMMGIVSCTKVFAKSYITVDTNQLCYTDQYWYYFYYFSLPLIITTSLIVPFGLFLCLFNNRKSLQTIKTRFLYGYLILGYSENKNKPIAIFWEIIVIYKKITTLALLNYFAGSGFNQGLLMLFTLLVYYMILKTFSPYKSEVLNQADEKITLIQCYIMVLALLLYVNIGSDSILWIGLTFLLLFNIYAIYFLAIGIFQDFKQDFQSFMTSYYYGKQCQESCPIFGRWFQQPKVSTSRIRELWRKAYVGIVSWRNSYIELTQDFQQDSQFEDAYTVIEQNRTGRNNNSQLFEKLRNISLYNIQSNQTQLMTIDNGLSLINDNVVKDDSPLLTNNDLPNHYQYDSIVEQTSITINQCLNETFALIPYVIYQPEDFKILDTLTLSNIGNVIQHKINYVFCIGPSKHYGMKLCQVSPQNIIMKKDGDLIYNSMSPQKNTFIVLEFLQGVPISYLSTCCNKLPTSNIDHKQITVELQVSQDKILINCQKLTPMYKHASPKSLSPFLVGCYQRKQPTSKRYKFNVIAKTNYVKKAMKINTPDFDINVNNLQNFAISVPYTLDGNIFININEALIDQTQFTLILSYVVLSMRKFQVKIACVWKQSRWQGQIIVRSQGYPALLGDQLKQQKEIYVDNLMNYLQQI